MISISTSILVLQPNLDFVVHEQLINMDVLKRVRYTRTVVNKKSSFFLFQMFMQSVALKSSIYQVEFHNDSNTNIPIHILNNTLKQSKTAKADNLELNAITYCVQNLMFISPLFCCTILPVLTYNFSGKIV